MQLNNNPYRCKRTICMPNIGVVCRLHCSGFNLRISYKLKTFGSIYSRAPISADSVSTVSFIRGLTRPETKFEN
jgi:hypothetical protein